MPAITVTSDQLTQLSGTVHGRNNDVSQTLASLKNEIDNVVGNGWTGNASGAFGSLYEEWQTSAGKLQDALHGIGNLLNSAGQQYAQTESHITSSMNQ
jgi:WXG100 family type VII secretion target